TDATIVRRDAPGTRQETYRSDPTMLRSSRRDKVRGPSPTKRRRRAQTVRDDELRDLRSLNPDSYVLRSPLWSGPGLLAFDARDPADFDWMERMILDHGYYEHEGVWDLARGFDKQAMAEIMAAFRPQYALEIGCATGTVLHYLAEVGVPCEGVEISRMAV